jgi:hypothetical protein
MFKVVGELRLGQPFPGVILSPSGTRCGCCAVVVHMCLQTGLVISKQLPHLD